MKERAIVLEAKDGMCTVLTADGDFRRLKMRGSFRPGQEITLPAPRRKVGMMALVAASLLLFFTVTALWRTTMAPAVAAYVSLDINPAVELALDSNNVVCGVRPLDEDGRDLTAGLELNGMVFEDAVGRILAAAAGKKYITPEEGNTIVTTITPVGEKKQSDLDALVRESLKSSLATLDITAEVLVGSAPADIREKADKEGIPPGRYMMFLDAEEKGMNFKLDDFRGRTIPTIEKERKIKVKEGLKVEDEGGNSRSIKPGRDGDGRDGDVRDGRKPRDGGAGEDTPGKGQGKGAGVPGRDSGDDEGRDNDKEEDKDNKEEKKPKERKDEKKEKKEGEGSRPGGDQGKVTEERDWPPRGGSARDGTGRHEDPGGNRPGGLPRLRFWFMTRP